MHTHIAFFFFALHRVGRHVDELPSSLVDGDTCMFVLAQRKFGLSESACPPPPRYV